MSHFSIMMKQINETLRSKMNYFEIKIQLRVLP